MIAMTTSSSTRVNPAGEKVSGTVVFRESHKNGSGHEWHCRLIHEELRRIASDASFRHVFQAALKRGFPQRRRITEAMLALKAPFVSPLITSGSAIRSRHLLPALQALHGLEHFNGHSRTFRKTRVGGPECRRAGEDRGGNVNRVRCFNPKFARSSVAFSTTAASTSRMSTSLLAKKISYRQSKSSRCFCRGLQRHSKRANRDATNTRSACGSCRQRNSMGSRTGLAPSTQRIMTPESA